MRQIHQKIITSVHHSVTEGGGGHQAEIQKALAYAHLATLGEISAGLVHEMGNLMMTIALNTSLTINQMKKDKPDMAQAHESLSNTTAAITHISSLLDQLRTFSQKDNGPKTPLNMELIVRHALRLLPDIGKSIPLIIHADDDLPDVLGNRRQLEQVLMNLLLNAQYALKDRKRPEIKIKIFISSDRKTVSITITDNGKGIKKTHQKKIFKPFFTTKGPKKGTGLGLAISKIIIEENHKGHITCLSKYGQGASFTLSLPNISDFI